MSPATEPHHHRPWWARAGAARLLAAAGIAALALAAVLWIAAPGEADDSTPTPTPPGDLPTYDLGLDGVEGAAANGNRPGGYRVNVPGVTSNPLPTPTPTPIPTPTPTPEPPPPPPPIDPGLLALEAQLTASVANYWVPGQYAVAVTDLQTGQTIGVNLDQWQLSACVMNFFALLTVVRDLELGVYAYTPMIDGLIAETIRSSNASTAYELYGITGGGSVLDGVAKVSHVLAGVWGIDGVVIDHPPLFGHVSLGVNPNNWVTPRGVNDALARLYHGELLSPQWTDYLLTRMTGVKPGLNYLTAYGNGGVTSHKNGFFPYEGGYVDNDAGIVRFWRGDRQYAYAVSFYSQGVAEKYADIPLAQDMMQQIWAYFDAKYP